MAADGKGSAARSLFAEYSGPDASKDFEHATSALPDKHSVEEKTTYLASLRTSVSKLQEEINTFLTKQMEQDNAQAADTAKGIDDKNDEENYGEEVVDDA